MAKFRLSENFLSDYIGKQPAWGPLGYIVYKRTYARPVPQENRTEEYWETLKRVVEGTYNIQKEWCEKNVVYWNGVKAQNSAQEMFKLMWDFKFLPPGRGLWMMGTDFVEKKGSAALNNCAFVSTKDLATDFAEPFTFLMDMSMLGVGVGGDTKGAGTIRIKEPRKGTFKFVVEDSREGWVELVRTYLNAYVGKGSIPGEVDYSKVRPYGAPINGFGGTSSGPGPLKQLVESDIPSILDPLIEQEGGVTGQAIVDIFNAIGRCVVSGNVRRSAEIMFGEPEDTEFLELKNPVINADKLQAWRWASNNSVFAKVGMDYSDVATRTATNGEPGYFWLQNARDWGRFVDPPNYKDRRAEGANPCSEQTLESYELCCVSADTKILTRFGYYEISKLVDKKVEVWNGQEWSQVTPFVAGHNKDLYRVHLSDGSYLDVTDNHKWSARFPTASKFKQLETMQLEVGMQLEPTEIQANDMDGSFSVGDMAYAWGFFAGDGFIDNKQIMLALHGSKDALTKDYFKDIGGKIYKEQHPEGYSESFSRVNLTAIEDRTVSLNLAKELNNKNKGIPSHFFSMNHEDTLGFIAGWIDSDGSLTNQVDTDNYRIFGTETKMRDMQLLLRRVGVNHASIYKMASAGEVLVINNKEVTRKHDLWVCYIPSYECKEIAEYCIVKKATRFGDRYKTNNAYPNGAKIDKARNQYVESIEKLDGKHTVYCFTEPKRHMGVFGNVLTYQCLVETFPGRHESLAEYIRTLKYAYLYAKTVTLLPTHNARTNAVMLRNRRIGTSQSGVVESFAKHGIREHYRWCDEGYKYLRSLDVVYSEWLCIPESRKITSIKPSGTVSLLPGASPGVHFPYGEYYWRTVRFDSGSELLEALRRSGYRIEQGETETTSVVYFPVKEQNFTRARRDVSIWEQLEIVAQMQHWWADNQVSVTVTFNKQEAADIPRALELYETRLKSVSFLPLWVAEPDNEDNESKYLHPPLQPMTKEEYEKEAKRLKPIELKKQTETDGFKHKFCDNDICTLE